VPELGHVQVERSQGIVTVTLSNPAKHNAIPTQLTLPQALEAEAQIVNVGTKAPPRPCLHSSNAESPASEAPDQWRTALADCVPTSIIFHGPK
jgi:hypothetical protein